MQATSYEHSGRYRQCQAGAKSAASTAAIREAEFTTRVSDLEAAAQRAETLHASKTQQLYQKIQLLEADACAHASRQEKDADHVSTLAQRADTAQRGADELSAQIRALEAVRWTGRLHMFT